VISTKWLQKRKPYWERLEQLLAITNREGLKSLDRRQLRELSGLYRQSAADLSALRVDGGGQQYTRYLNHLLASAHNTIYAGTRPKASAILTFYGRTYPALFRRNSAFCFTAFALFAVAAGVSVLVTLDYPDFQNFILGPTMIATIRRHEMWTHSIVGIKPLASSGIMTNNMSVAFTTFAFGITAGIGTIYMVVFNGVLFGVISTACVMAGMGKQLFSFVAPHGVLELPAIFIAAGAGLRLAKALLFPGLMSRKTALRYAGREAVQLLLGTIPMLIIAGIIEAFVSPTDLAVAAKFTLAAALALALFLYLMSGQQQRTTDLHG
jgi:uncharacterized membrane protein SpoIIM required for sporulation